MHSTDHYTLVSEKIKNIPRIIAKTYDKKTYISRKHMTNMISVGKIVFIFSDNETIISNAFTSKHYAT